jgi:WNK lysine deficient protein kinase
LLVQKGKENSRFGVVASRDRFGGRYKGFDAVDGIEVAWAKVEITGRIMGSPKELQRLKTEIQLLRSLQHKHILKLYASWVDNKKRTVNIITELFTSGNLRQYVCTKLIFRCMLNVQLVTNVQTFFCSNIR